MPSQDDIAVAADNLCDVFGRDWTRSKQTTLRLKCAALPSSRRPEVVWSLNVLEQAGEPALRAAMPPAPKKATTTTPKKATRKRKPKAVK